MKEPQKGRKAKKNKKTQKVGISEADASDSVKSAIGRVQKRLNRKTLSNSRKSTGDHQKDVRQNETNSGTRFLQFSARFDA